MQTILRPFKFLLALPFYVIAFVSTLLILLATRVIDAIYPDKKTSVSFMRALMGFNTSQIDLDEGRPSPRPLGVRIYK